MRNRKLMSALVLAGAAIATAPVQAWWGPWGNGPGGYNSDFGPFDGFLDGVFDFNASFSGHGRGYGRGNGRGYGYGYSRYAGYPYPAPYAYLPVVATRAVPAAAVEPVDADGDRDGVADSRDLCLDTAVGVKVDFTGCAEAEPIALEGVNFKLDSDELTPESSTILDRVVRTLVDHPELKVEVGGHTDSQGEAAYNLDLSARRAATVREYLIGKGVPAGNLTSNGYGLTRPIASNDTAEGRASNRRVELTRLDATLANNNQ
jgi:outer membrane protein OmpA-like peptidoglycan-associated protein